MEKKVHLSLCQDASCPFGSNKTVLAKIRDYLHGNNLENRVEFGKMECSGRCSNGLLLNIDGNQLRAVDSENINLLLELCLQPDYYC